MSKEIAEEYASSLSDLTVNSKPLINMLTILAEENIDHAGVIVDTVEKHLAKVDSDIKLPVLYLVDSIVKNVGGAYIQKFSQCIVNMFTRTFKAVDEKVRSQMFKLRETWHDVFPAMKLYQLDVKVNLLDPAWPIQAQPSSTSSIHVNPNFLKKSAPTTSAKVPTPEEDENIRSILAKKEQELLMLQQKKIEIELQNARRDLELQNTRRALEIAASTNSKSTPIPNINAAVAQMPLAQMPVAMVTPVPAAPDAAPIPIKQRLGPPVNKAATTARIAPVSAALAAARRDPRLARRPAAPAAPAPPPRPPIAPNVFDIKPLERVTKRKNVITIDVRADAARRDPRPGNARPDLTNPERIDALREKIRVHTAAREARRDDRKLKALKSERKNEQKAILDNYMDKLQIADAKKINKLPPIPKINREASDEPLKRKKDATRADKKKKRDSASGKDSAESSPEKKQKTRKSKKEREEADEAAAEVVAFKALRNYHPERYMRRNRARSPSPDPAPAPATAPAPAPAPAAVTDSTNVTEVVENKDVDLRVLHPAISDAVGQKRSSTEGLEPKPKKSKSDKFDRLFGNEDVDLRQLPQVEETTASVSPKPAADSGVFTQDAEPSSPAASPKKDWNEVKEREETKKTPSKLDLVRAKLAEATKGHDKDRLGRPFLFSKSPSVEKERRRTVSTEDVDLRLENTEEFVAADHKKTINIIMDQAQEQYTGGKIDNDQYKTLLFQVFQLNEKLKLKEAKQRESLEISKLKLKAHIDEEVKKIRSPKVSPKGNNFGDIDERVIPAFSEAEAPLDAPNFMQDSDMRMSVDGPHPKALLPRPPMMPMFGAPHPPMWRGPYRPRMDDFQQRPRGVVPPFFRGKFDRAPRFEPRVPFVQPLPTPQMGTCQGECPLEPYVRTTTPPPLGAPSVHIPSTNIQALEYIDLDPIKTIQIDGIPREIRFYGETAIIMLDWDDPREIKFLPGSRRVTFDNKDSVVLNFNEPYKQVEIEDQVFDIRFGAPTRELFINGRWHECFFGGAPLGVIIDGKPRLIHLEGPLPQVDIGKVKRTDLVAGKINLIVDATRMCPVFLDSKVQKFSINGKFFTIRFVDALRTVLINEQPFQVEFGGLPRPVFIGNEKHFIRFSVLPRHVRPGFNAPADMQGAELAAPARSPALLPPPGAEPMETDQEMKRPIKTPSPEGNQGGLDMLASVMPSPMAPASASSDYSSAEPIFLRPATIPGLDTPATPEETPAPALATPNINDLFAKLLATGIIQVPAQPKEAKVEPKVEEKKPREDRSVVHRVDLGRPETLRVKQPALVAKLYGGMQCSGCGARFPPEHTVRYSQHLDWHFRQNRRERDSARRAHSRDWHYDLADWLQYEELEDLEERKKSWFETMGLQAGPAAAQSPPPPSVAAGPPARAACALCGDAFLQFYNEDREEWHLRNSVSHEGENYHPLCLEDYKASQTKKEEQPKEELPEAGATGAEGAAAGADEAIEIRDGDDADQSDNESVVEVIEPEKPEIEVLDDAEPSQPEAPLDVEADDDEDDVVFKAEPVVQLVVDDYDTDDETAAARGARDEQAKIDFANVRVKQEPIDPDDEPIITSEEEAIRAPPDTSRPTVMSTIDGNVLDAPAQASALPGIRINISKPLVPVEKSPPPPLDSLEDVSADEEPPPPGEEPELEYKLKPSLEGVVFSRQPPKQKGTELSGLCSIM